MIAFNLDKIGWCHAKENHIDDRDLFLHLFQTHYFDFHRFLEEYEINWELDVKEFTIGRLGILIVIAAKLVVNDSEDREFLCKLVF